MKGSCMWVCGSMPPGSRYWPLASSVCVPEGAWDCRSAPTAAMRPSTHRTSAANSRSALTTVPPRIKRAELMRLAPEMRPPVRWRPVSSRAAQCRALGGDLAGHADTVDRGRDAQSDEPGVGVDLPEQIADVGEALREGRAEEARQVGQHTEHEGQHGHPVPAAAVAVLATLAIELI